MKKSKLKIWYERHKGEIKADAVRLTYYALGFGVAWFAGRKLLELQVDSGLQAWHNFGVLKFVDPSTGLDIDVTKAAEIVREK